MQREKACGYVGSYELSFKVQKLACSLGTGRILWNELSNVRWKGREQFKYLGIDGGIILK
jgi:hypothetical protein